MMSSKAGGAAAALAVAVVAVSLLSAQAPAASEAARAMALAAKGNFQEAERILLTIEKSDPKNAEIQYALGLISLRQGKPAAAAKSFEAAVSLTPGSSLAWIGLAQARLRLGQRAPALDAAGSAAKLGDREPPVWRALALFYSDAGEFARAAEFEERWSRVPGADAGSRGRLCQWLVRAADRKRAVEACRQALAGGETAALQQLLGDAYRLAGDPAHAAEAYQRAIRLEPSQPGPYLQLVALFLDHRTPQPAIAVLDSAIVRFPKEPEFRRRLGLARYQTGAIPEAIDAFLAAIDLDPDAESGYASLETLFPDAGPRMAEIIQRLRAFSARRPSSPVGHFLLARALAVEGSGTEEVKALLRQAIQADATFWPAQFELAQILEREGTAAEAIPLLESVVKVNPEHAPSHYSLAQLYAKTGDRTRAIAHRKTHHALLDRERVAAEKARAESPTLTFKIDAPDR